MKFGFSGLYIAGRLLRQFYKRHPLRMVLVFVGNLVVGLLENIGVVVMLPLLHILLSEGAEKQSVLARYAADGFALLGIPPTILPAIIVIIALVFLKAATGFVVTVFNQTAILSVGYELRMALAQRIVLSRWPFLLKQPTGRYANLMNAEINLYTTGYTASFGVLNETIHVALYLGTALLVSWQFTAIATLIGVLMVTLLGPTVTMVARASARRTEQLNRLSSLLVEVLQGIKPLKSMSREVLVVPLLKREALGLFRAQRLVAISSALRASIPELFLVTSMGIGLYTAVELIGVSLASIMVLALLFVRIMTRIGVWQGRLHQLMNLSGSIDAVDAAIDEASVAAESLHGGHAPVLEKEIRLENVSIAYDDKQVLDGVNMVFPVNQLSVIFGASGSGKTSVLDSIIGFVEPRHGTVLVDGAPLSGLNLGQWRAGIGYVPQELFLFHDTIRANLTFGDPDISEADIAWAIEVSGATDFIDGLSNGIETTVGERGMMISGGQRQRLSIARALIGRPKLLLLDEATSALDAQTENDVCGTISELSKRITVIAVSHRPAILSLADHVYSIENGQVSRGEPGDSAGVTIGKRNIDLTSQISTETIE